MSVRGAAIDCIILPYYVVIIVGTISSHNTSEWISAPQGSVLGPGPSLPMPRMSPTFSSSIVPSCHRLFEDHVQGIKHSKPSLPGLEPVWSTCITAARRSTSDEYKLESRTANLTKISHEDKDDQFGSTIISPSTVVRDLEVFLDAIWNTPLLLYHLRRLHARYSSARAGDNSSSSLGICFIATWLL